MNQLFKNVTIVKASLPESSTFNTLVEPMGFTPLDGQAHTIRTYGFVLKEETMPELGYAKRLTDGYAFTVRIQERIIPSSVVTEETDKRIAAFKEAGGRKYKRGGIKDEVLLELIPKAFIRTTNVLCVYLKTSGLLLIANTGNKVLNTVYGMLLRTLEHENIQIQDRAFDESRYHAVTQNILNLFLDTGDASGFPLEIVDYVKLSEPDNGEKNGTVFKNASLDDLQASFSKAFQMAQTIVDTKFSNGAMSFKMAVNGKLRSIKFLEAAGLETDFEDSEEHYNYLLESESALLADVVKTIDALFNYDTDDVI